MRSSGPLCVVVHETGNVAFIRSWDAWDVQVSECPMATIDALGRLLGRMTTMSAADLSVLEAGLQIPDVCLTTQPGSANDVLWKEMEALGWLQGSDESLRISDRIPFPLRKYALREVGRAPIAALLARFRELKRPPAEIDSQLLFLGNTFCAEFLRDLRDRVVAVGGNRGDVEYLLAATLARWMKAGRSHDDAISSLDHCFEMARKHLAKTGQPPS